MKGKELKQMNRELKPDFERYLKTLHCEEPDRVPQGDWHVDHRPKEAFMGRPVKTLQDQVDFWYAAGFRLHDGLLGNPRTGQGARGDDDEGRRGAHRIRR